MLAPSSRLSVPSSEWSVQVVPATWTSLVTRRWVAPPCARHAQVVHTGTRCSCKALNCAGGSSGVPRTQPSRPRQSGSTITSKTLPNRHGRLACNRRPIPRSSAWQNVSFSSDHWGVSVMPVEACIVANAHSGVPMPEYDVLWVTSRQPAPNASSPSSARARRAALGHHAKAYWWNNGGILNANHKDLKSQTAPCSGRARWAARAISTRRALGARDGPRAPYSTRVR